MLAAATYLSPDVAMLGTASVKKNLRTFRAERNHQEGSPHEDRTRRYAPNNSDINGKVSALKIIPQPYDIDVKQVAPTIPMLVTDHSWFEWKAVSLRADRKRKERREEKRDPVKGKQKVS